MDTSKGSTTMQHWIGLLTAGLLVVGPVVLGGCTTGTSVAANGSGSPVIVMEEMRFSPNRLDMKVGQTVVVTLVNKGSQRHDLAFPSAEMPGLAGIETLTMPGATSHVTLRFDRPGTYPFLCTIEGHAVSGMTGAVYVSP
jgi:plastocyanin